jgi:hypothetical protein
VLQLPLPFFRNHFQRPLEWTTVPLDPLFSFASTDSGCAGDSLKKKNKETQICGKYSKMEIRQLQTTKKLTRGNHLIIYIEDIIVSLFKIILF